MLYGIWEDGQQNMWFDEATVRDIENGLTDARDYFLKAHNKRHEIAQRFSRPEGFAEKLQLLELKFGINVTVIC